MYSWSIFCLKFDPLVEQAGIREGSQYHNYTDHCSSPAQDDNTRSFMLTLGYCWYNLCRMAGQWYATSIFNSASMSTTNRQQEKKRNLAYNFCVFNNNGISFTCFASQWQLMVIKLKYRNGNMRWMDNYHGNSSSMEDYEYILVDLR